MQGIIAITKRPLIHVLKAPKEEVNLIVTYTKFSPQDLCAYNNPPFSKEEKPKSLYRSRKDTHYAGITPTKKKTKKKIHILDNSVMYRMRQNTPYIKETKSRRWHWFPVHEHQGCTASQCVCSVYTLPPIQTQTTPCKW